MVPHIDRAQRELLGLREVGDYVAWISRKVGVWEGAWPRSLGPSDATVVGLLGTGFDPIFSVWL